MSSLQAVRERYREIHGDQETSRADDARLLAGGHRPVTDEQQLTEMAAGRLPMPPYLLSDGTPVAPEGHLDPVDWAGGAAGLRDWFVAYWPEQRREHAEQAFTDWMAGRHGWLDPATPRTLCRVERARAQAREAIARLAEDPRDPVGRGSLAEALDGLDALLRADTDLERDRHGGATPREAWVVQPRRDHLAVALPELPIRTDRLTLRMPSGARDTEELHAIYGRADVATYLLQTPSPRAEFDDRMRAWDTAGERVLRVVIELEGRVVGDVELMFRGPSTAEIGWTIHPDVAGRGIATEAARALLEVGFGHYGFHRIYADLDARNDRSARLCERLGMRREVHRLQDVWSKGEWTDSFQYGVLATEWSASDDAAGPVRSTGS